MAVFDTLQAENHRILFGFTETNKRLSVHIELKTGSSETTLLDLLICLLHPSSH